MARYRDLVSPEMLEPSIWKTLLAIETQAVHLVAVDKGDLKNSITIQTSEREQSYGNTDDKLTSISISYEGAIGTASDHATANEFGRPDMPNYPAQPFLRPAALMIKNKHGQIAKEEYTKQLTAFLERYPFKDKA
jgi:hypothetical protein